MLIPPSFNQCWTLLYGHPFMENVTTTHSKICGLFWLFFGLFGETNFFTFFGSNSPAKFVVLGPASMTEMQKRTLKYYDKHWKTVGWASGRRGTEAEYQTWRKMTYEEISGRWGSCSYMIAIVMQRQSGKKRLPEWEEAAAVATAVQNMHLQSTKFPGVGCYWSSWHDAFRDSKEMKTFLNMHSAPGSEDKCMGFFIVAQIKPGQKDRRKRRTNLLKVEWRK